MPASARAVYAPRENPKMHILSSAWSNNEDERRHSDNALKGRTLLHQEFISPYECDCKRAKYSNCQLRRRTHDVRVKMVADGHINTLFHLCHKRCCDIWNRIRPNASL